jgi:hypothetical protein
MLLSECPQLVSKLQSLLKAIQGKEVVIKDLEEKKQLYVSQAKSRLRDLEVRVIASGIPKEWAGKSR